MTNPSPRPRVLLESDAGAMDQLIRRGEQAATVAEQKALELAQAGQGLEQLKATVPATAKSAAELATAQAKATLDAATLAANQAAVTAQTATATLPKFRSTDQNNPPAPTQGELDANPNGIGGSRLTADGATQLLKWTPHTTAGAWVASGAPLPTTTQVADAKKTATDAATLADNAKEAADTAKSVADTAQGALRNTALADLRTKRRADGPQIVDGSRWLSQITGSTPEDGGTAVLGVDCIWVREFVGPVYAPWFGCQGDGVTLDDEPMQRAALAAQAHGAALDLDDLTYVLRQVTLTRGLTVQNGRVLTDTTGGGANRTSPFYFDGQDHSPARTRATMEAARIYDIVFRNVEMDGRRGQMYDVSGFGDGARGLVSVWGRASRILFDRCDLHHSATDAVILLTNDGQAGMSSIPAEQVDWDPCFIDVEFRDCKLHHNRRCGASADGFYNIRLTGNTEIYANGVPLDGEPNLHGTTPDAATVHSGKQGAFVPSGGKYYYYGWGFDCEGYNVGSTSRGFYVAETVKIWGNAGQAVQFMVNDTEGNSPKFQPWGDFKVYGEVSKGVYNSEKEALTLVAFRPAGHDHLAGPSFIDVDFSPRILRGGIGIRACQSWRAAPRQAFDLADTGNYAGRTFGGAARSTWGRIGYPINDPTARFVCNEPGNVNATAVGEGTIPLPLVLPTLGIAGGDLAAPLPPATVISQDNGRVVIEYSAAMTPAAPAVFTVFQVAGLSSLTGTPYRITNLSAAARDNNSGAARITAVIATDQVQVSWAGSTGPHQVTVRVELAQVYDMPGGASLGRQSLTPGPGGV